MDDATTCGHRHGAVVGGRYRLGQVLRSGPERCEHRAHDELLRRAVTTVIAAPARGAPLPDAPTLPDSARTEHGPGLAEVYDGGGDGGVLYLVVPRVDGTCLADDLVAGPLPVDEVRALGVQIARVLLPVHRHGCAHGALGAEVVTRGPSGVTVAGLGVGEWLSRWAHQRYDPPHPAPEQRGPAPSVSPATDVYALGRLLGVAAGRLPRSDPLRAVLRGMTRRDPRVRPTTREVIDRLQGSALPGAGAPPGPGRALGGTLWAVALAGALALGGIVAHSSPPGLLGGATLGWGAPPSPVVDRPAESPPPAAAADDRTGGGSPAGVAVSTIRLTETVRPEEGAPVPSPVAVRTEAAPAVHTASSRTGAPHTAAPDTAVPRTTSPRTASPHTASPRTATHGPSPETLAAVPENVDPSTRPRVALPPAHPPRTATHHSAAPGSVAPGSGAPRRGGPAAATAPADPVPSDPTPSDATATHPTQDDAPVEDPVRPTTSPGHGHRPAPETRSAR